MNVSFTIVVDPTYLMECTISISGYSRGLLVGLNDTEVWSLHQSEVWIVGEAFIPKTLCKKDGEFFCCGKTLGYDNEQEFDVKDVKWNTEIPIPC